MAELAPAADTLPGSAAELEILRARAEQLASKPADEIEENGVQFIHFRLGRGEEYGVPYHYADEILGMQSITRTPCVPEIFSGVTNRRGELLAVVDLKRLFGIPAAEDHAGGDAAILVVRGNGLTLGLLVDDILGNEEYLPSRLAAALPSENFGDLECIEGIHNGRITILNLDRLLADPAINISPNDNLS